LGLFNYTPYSVGDDSYYNKKFPAREEINNRKVKTKPGHALPGGTKGGKNPSTYFGFYGREKYVDTYIEPHNVQKILAKKASKGSASNRCKHDLKFRNGNGTRLQ